MLPHRTRVAIDLRCPLCLGGVELEFADWRAQGEIIEQEWVCPHCEATNQNGFSGRIVWIAKSADLAGARTSIARKAASYVPLRPLMDAVLERVIRHDRAVVLCVLALISAFAWLYVLRLDVSMNIHDMRSLDMPGMRIAVAGLRMKLAPAGAPWTTVECVRTFVMWGVMMAGMMTPSVAPTALLYSRVQRQGDAARPRAATTWFVCGYLMAWMTFALLATGVQWALQRVGLLTPMMAVPNRLVAAVIFVIAGAYELSRFKGRCLTHCRFPLALLESREGGETRASVATALGFRHGLYCVGCCWALMTLLFVGGVMNVLWIAGIAVLVLLEKLLPAGKTIGQMSGVAFCVVAAWLFISP